MTFAAGDKLICPLCLSDETAFFHRDRWREYQKCADCSLVFVPPRWHLAPEEEKKSYDMAPNDPYDPRYREFLSKLIEPMLPLLKQGWRGLDFGSGTGPALAMMFEERGFEMAIYDPFYADDPVVLSRPYDFLTCTETAEHFCNPRREWERMTTIVRSGGVIGVTTQMLYDESRFANWQYKNEETHVAFYSRRTFEWIAAHFSLHAHFYGDSVVLFEV